MKRLLLALLALLLTTSCNAGYGPLQDYSAFVSARLADDQRSVVFTAHHFAYRPAAGWRAFPDGGIPRYVTDSSILGVYDRQTHEVKILLREKNRDWQPGSGLFTIAAVSGSKVLVAQGGQLRGPFANGLKHLLVDLATGTTERLDLKGDLARRGRDLGYLYLVDGDGTLVFINQSLEEAKDAKASRNQAVVPEIWVRTAAGDYLKVAASDHYHGVHQGEVIYWLPATRAFMAFSLATATTRPAPEFREGGYVDVTTGAIVSSDHKGLEYGVKVGDRWQYQRLDLTLEMLK